MKFLYLPVTTLLLTLVASCETAPEVIDTPEPDTGTVTNVTKPPPGCPDELDIRVVFQARYGKSQRKRLVLHEAIIPDDEDPIFEESEEGPVLRDLTVDEAQSVGIPTDRTPVWILGDDGLPVCFATPTTPLAFRDGDGFVYTHTGRLLEGNCKLPSGSNGLAWVAKVRPACTIAPTGDMSDHTLDTVRQLPLGDEEMAKALLDESCQPPCELRWKLQGQRIPNGQGLFELTVTHLITNPKEQECAWERRDFFGVFYEPAREAPMIRLPNAAGNASLIYDDDGIAGLVTHEDGVVTIYKPPAADGAVEPLRRYEWFIPHDEERTTHSLGESCL